MLLLTLTTDKVQLVSSAAGSLDVHASWVDNASGTITPGRTNTNIATATTTDVVAAPGSSTVRNIKTLNVRNQSASVANTVTILFNQNATTFELFKCSLAAGELLSYVEGLGWDIYSSDGSHKAQSARVLFKCLSADDTGQNIATVQPWFPTAGAVTIDANTTYYFEGMLLLNTGATSHSTSVGFGGTATVASIMWGALGKPVAAAGAIAAPVLAFQSAVTAVVIDTAAAAAESVIQVAGVVRFTTAGTFIPQYTFSVNPTGTILTKKNSFFRMWPIGDNNVASQGTWT
jgi:hypothetical protein